MFSKFQNIVVGKVKVRATEKCTSAESVFLMNYITEKLKRSSTKKNLFLEKNFRKLLETQNIRFFDKTKGKKNIILECYRHLTKSPSLVTILAIKMLLFKLAGFFS